MTFVSLLSLDLLFAFGVSTELFATTTFFGAIAFVIALCFAGRDIGRVLRAGLFVAVSYAIVGLLLLPFLTDALHHEPTNVLRPVDKTSIDLGSWVVPREHTRIGGESYTDITSRFTASSQEDAGYVGIAAVVMLVGFAITERKRRSTWALLAFLAVVAVLASGPVLHILGRPSIGLPGRAAHPRAAAAARDAAAVPRLCGARARRGRGDLGRPGEGARRLDPLGGRRARGGRDLARSRCERLPRVRDDPRLLHER